MPFAAELASAQGIKMGDAGKAFNEGVESAAKVEQARMQSEEIRQKIEDMKIDREVKINTYSDQLIARTLQSEGPMRKHAIKQLEAFNAKNGRILGDGMKAMLDDPATMNDLRAQSAQMWQAALKNPALAPEAIRLQNNLNGSPDIIKWKDDFEAIKAFNDANAKEEAARIRAKNTGFDNELARRKFIVERRKDIKTETNKNLIWINAGKQAEKALGDISKLNPADLSSLDNSLVSAYKKTQDPESIVMPAEYAAALTQSPGYQQLSAWFNKELGKGGTLPPDTRLAMARVIKDFTDLQNKYLREYTDEARKDVSAVGGDPRTIIEMNTTAQPMSLSDDQIRKFKSQPGGRTYEQMVIYSRAKGIAAPSKQKFDSIKIGGETK